ncbi:MAG: HD domain-containing protein [Phycisphaerae bacterium]|nr:HD domain-containing protein [Phycisphaerae bacterium]
MQSEGVSSGHLLLVGPEDPLRRLETVLADQPWRQFVARAPEEAMLTLRMEPTIDLVIIRPGSQLKSSIDLCRYINLEPSTSFVSVVFIRDEASSEDRTAIFQAGADDCIQLPATQEEIIARLQHAITIKRTTDSLEDAAVVITSLANAIEGRDAYTCGHTQRVGTYCLEIAEAFEFGSDDLQALRMGAVVHDIGKVRIPDQILNKPGRLTDEEMEIIKEHPLIGYDILQPLRTFRKILPIVRWHHERPNGTGYPDGIGGDDLPLLPRIVAVADFFDAISTDRPYRKAMPLSQCAEIMRHAASDGHLDANIVELLLQIIGHGNTDAAAPSAQARSA